MAVKARTTTIVLIPAYQPGEALIESTNRLLNDGYTVVVVDDGSGVDYRSVFKRLAHSIHLVSHDTNRGKGAALKTGYRYIRDHFDDFIIATADADGQHDASDIQKVAKAYKQHPGSLLLGSRTFEDGQVPLRSRFGNILTRKIFSLITKIRITDTQTGLRVFDASLIDFMIGVSGERFEYEMNVLLACSRAHVPIVELPIKTIYENGNNSSHFNPIKDSLTIYGQILKFSSASLRRITTITFTLLLVALTAYILLDTFVLVQRYRKVSSSVSVSSSQNASAASRATIDFKTYRVDDTSIYVADVKLPVGQLVQAALADNTYGKNITATTSSIASSVGATLAINGDFYGARNDGYVIRNRELLRTSKVSDHQEDMALWSDGTMSIITEGKISANALYHRGVVQLLSFGPGLIIDGKINVKAGEEVDISMVSNPRTAVGYTSDGRYLFIVADGRTAASKGLSLLQLAQFMQSLGAHQAYNLDGGGSATMYYQGKVVNRPTTFGQDFSERKVSDILYVK